MMLRDILQRRVFALAERGGDAASLRQQQAFSSPSTFWREAFALGYITEDEFEQVRRTFTMYSWHYTGD